MRQADCNFKGISIKELYSHWETTKSRHANDMERAEAHRESKQYEAHHSVGFGVFTVYGAPIHPDAFDRIWDKAVEQSVLTASELDGLTEEAVYFSTFWDLFSRDITTDLVWYQTLAEKVLDEELSKEYEGLYTKTASDVTLESLKRIRDQMSSSRNSRLGRATTFAQIQETVAERARPMLEGSPIVDMLEANNFNLDPLLFNMDNERPLRHREMIHRVTQMIEKGMLWLFSSFHQDSQPAHAGGCLSHLEAQAQCNTLADPRMSRVLTRTDFNSAVEYWFTL